MHCNASAQVGIITPAQQILDLRYAILNSCIYSIGMSVLYRALEVMRFVENDATKLSLWLREISWYLVHPKWSVIMFSHAAGSVKDLVAALFEKYHF